MKFGLHLFGHHPADASPVDNFDTVLEQARAARRAGFDLVWCGHHYLVTDRQKFQVVPALGRVAAETGDMHVGTAFLLPLHHPVIVAEQFATLDAITGGRAILGPVAGYREEEFDALGIDRAERAGRLAEGVEAIGRLWTEDDVTFRGEHYRFEDVTITPKPVQDPRPPIWVGANADAAVRRASELGDAWLANPHADEETLARQIDLAGPPDGEGFRGVQPARRDVFVAGTDAEALDRYGPHIEEFYAWYRNAGQAEAMEDPDALDQPLERLRRERFVIGSPETVADGLVRLHDDVGVDCVLMGMDRPGLDHDAVLRSIELTGEEVIPRVRERLGERGD